MAGLRHSLNSTPSTSVSCTSYPYDNTTTNSRPRTARRSYAKSRTTRPRTGVSHCGGLETQQIICAVSESRGVSPTVGLAFVNLDTCEAVLCQICDSQTYVRTLHKIHVYGPSEILVVSTAADPKSKLLCVVQEEYSDIITLLDRRYWTEARGLEYIQKLALVDDLETIRVAIAGNYFAICCIAAVLQYIEGSLSKSFPMHSLRVKYEPSEGSMMIDVSTIYALELIQNLHNPRSRDCLFGLLNEVLTPMGSRLLRSNILQPLTNQQTLELRYDALEELTVKEEVFFRIREVLKEFIDVDRLLTSLVIVPMNTPLSIVEQSVNNVIMLRQFISTISPIHEALSGVESVLLTEIQDYCAVKHVFAMKSLIDSVINEDVKFSHSPLDLRYQRTFAVKSGVNGLLDVSRTTFKENSEDVISYIVELSEIFKIKLDLKFDSIRQYYIRLRRSELEGKKLTGDFINIVEKRNYIECQTMALVKKNQKIVDSHNECLMMSDQTIQELLIEIKGYLPVLFKISESIAMLDMMVAFAHLATSENYSRPHIGSGTMAIKGGRHPIKEKAPLIQFVPNDVYSTQQTRFQVITGCNMSGKSTYIRSIALMVVMAQIGSFVPARFAAFPLHHQLFARVSVDDSIDANVSTFAAEMQEISFILRNIDRRSIAIIDELGRGTSTRDGLAITVAIAEALIDSHALVWLATHFRELAMILGERNGVANLHLAAEMHDTNTLTMLYKVAEGPLQEDHYGLALARLMPLPAQVVEHATHVAKALAKQQAAQSCLPSAVTRQRRRRLVLSLKEHLVQAYRGNADGATLTARLQELQREFVTSMSALDAERGAA